MRWEDERYVRLYTRDTVDWHFLSFEAQGLFALLMRKVDRAGILALGRHGLKGIAAAIGHPSRWEAIKSALDELVADKCVVITETSLVIPNFLEAQEAKSSDKERQRKSRELARLDQTAMSQNVTDCHAPSHAVTSGHTASHDVTPSRAVLSRTEPAVPEKTAGDERPQLDLVPPAPRAKKQKPDKTTDPRHAPVLKALVDASPGYSPAGRDFRALSDLLAMGTDEEILTRWRRALARAGYPTVRAIHELEAHWPHFATDAPPRGAVDIRKSPIRAEDIPKAAFAVQGDVTDAF